MRSSHRLVWLTTGIALGVVAAASLGYVRAARASQQRASLEQRVSRLEDEQQIRQLYARYMHYLDHRDMVRYSQLFTADGVVVADMGKWVGRAAMQKMFEPRVGTDGKVHTAPPPMIHMVTDIVLHVHGNEARGWAKYFAFFPGKGPGERTTVSGIGGYNDWLVRVNGVWLFKKRIITRTDPPIEF
jgi:ketosteroid isomerase-like protein